MEELFLRHVQEVPRGGAADRLQAAPWSKPSCWSRWRRGICEKHRQLRMTIKAQQIVDDELTRPQEEDRGLALGRAGGGRRRMEEDLGKGREPPRQRSGCPGSAKDPEDDLDVARRLDWVSVMRVSWQFFHGQRKRDLAPEIQGAEAELERLVCAYADLREASRSREELPTVGSRNWRPRSARSRASKKTWASDGMN